MNSYYTKFIDEAGQYRFNLKSGNHRIILKSSEGYSSSQSCDKGIDSVRVNSPLDDRYQRRKSINDQYYFNLKARNGEIIGVSETYVTRSGRDEGIRDVMRLAPNAKVRDLTAAKAS